MKEKEVISCDKCGKKIDKNEYYHIVTVKNVNQHEEEYPSKELYHLCYDCEPTIFKNMKSSTRILL